MDIFSRFFAGLLSTFYSFTHNYALAILLLTITVMIFVAPLTLKSVRSMMVMQKVAPELQKLQEKYKNDREKLSSETMAFYKENNINPLSGCFPILLQMPIFLVLYYALNGLLNRENGVSAPKYLDESSPLFRDLVASDGRMEAFGVNFSASALSPHPSLLAAIPFFALILAMVFFQYWQQRQINARATTSADNPQAEMMRKFTKIMPPFFGLISLAFPAALVLYWTYQSIIRVIQQWAMYKFDPVLKDEIKSARKDVKSHLDDGPKPVNAKKKKSTESAASAAKKTTKSKSKGR